MSYTEEKIKFYTNTNKLNADRITKSENHEGTEKPLNEDGDNSNRAKLYILQQEQIQLD